MIGKAICLEITQQRALLMQTKPFKQLACVLATGGLFTFFQQAAIGAQLHFGWNYALDAADDSLALRPDNTRQAGGTIYEIGGIAFKDDVETDSVWFAISANLPLFGHNTGPQLCPVGDTQCYPVANSNVGWGDLILDFSGSGDLKTASDNRQLFGIRFAPGNDSKAPFLGVYRDVQLTSVVAENAGYPTLANHNNMLNQLTGRTTNMGDLAWNDPYFESYTRDASFDNLAAHMPNVIGSGTKIGEVTLLGRDDLVKVGLNPDFFQANNSEIFGFRIPKSLLPAGEFIATLLLECLNDGVSLVSQLAATPPPPSPPSAQICPVTEGQLNALEPTRIINGVKVFDRVPSGLWYDPPAMMGFQFVTDGDTLFTAVNGFPCAIAPPDSPEGTQPAPFNVLVKNEQGVYEIIGQYFPGQSVNFEQIYGKGVSEFLITGIDPNAWVPWLPPEGTRIDNRLAFPFTFNKPPTEPISFVMRQIDVTQISPPSDSPELPIPIPPVPPIPDPIGPGLRPPCLEENGCATAAVPEPSTIAGLALASAGWFKLRRRHSRKITGKD